MKLIRYLYLGPQSAACLRVEGSTNLLDVQLLQGQIVELPADHEYTGVLLALKHLVLAPTDAAPQSLQTPAPGSGLGAQADTAATTGKKGGKS